MICSCYLQSLSLFATLLLKLTSGPDPLALKTPQSLIATSLLALSTVLQKLTFMTKYWKLFSAHLCADFPYLPSLHRPSVVTTGCSQQSLHSAIIFFFFQGTVFPFWCPYHFVMRKIISALISKTRYCL